MTAKKISQANHKGVGDFRKSKVCLIKKRKIQGGAEENLEVEWNRYELL